MKSLRQPSVRSVPSGQYQLQMVVALLYEPIGQLFIRNLQLAGCNDLIQHHHIPQILLHFLQQSSPARSSCSVHWAAILPSPMSFRMILSGLSPIWLS